MKRGKSGLTLRERQPNHQTLIELTPRQVTQWAKSLPIANLGSSAKNIYRLLTDLNHSLVDNDKKLAMLNIIQPVADKLVNLLEERFAKHHIILNEKSQKIAALVQAIQTELFISYHGIIDSLLLEGDLGRSKRKMLNQALVESIRYHGLVILRCYKLYTSIPGRIWQELYSLYQIAIQNELTDNQIKLPKSKETLSCHDYFVRILLLEIANTYQLRQQEITLLWEEMLPPLVEHAVLNSHAYNNNHFVIALSSSFPPIHKSLYKSEDKNSTLKLTVSNIIEPLNQMLASIKHSDHQSSRKTMLIRHLIQCWGSNVHRAFARTSCSDFLDICIGLGATHYLLMQKSANGSNDATGATNQLEAMEGSLKHATLHELGKKERQQSKNNINYLSSSVPQGNDVWTKLYGHKNLEDTTGLESNSRSRDAIVKESYRLQSVGLLNMSPGGYCIQLDSDDLPKHAQTGEILGLRELEQGTEQWSVGVVRWVKRQSKGTIIQMGVQLLAPSSIPINIQLRDSRANTNEYQRALILPELSGLGQPATLLTNSVSFNVNNKVRIAEYGSEYDARLCKELASSGSFKQFEFERIAKDGDTKPPKKDPIGDPSLDSEELKEVWDLI